ncbi:MAG: DUF2683 family protein [Candidatus Pacearchaeota archaeon]|jgi:hypothetical protein
MVNALIKIDENINRIMNIIKARHGLKDKGEVVEFVIKKFAEYESEPDLLPEFVKKIHKIERQKSIKVDDFAKRYGLK